MNTLTGCFRELQGLGVHTALDAWCKRHEREGKDFGTKMTFSDSQMQFFALQNASRSDLGLRQTAQVCFFSTAGMGVWNLI